MLSSKNRLKNKKAFIATYYNNDVVKSESIVLNAGKIKTDKNCPTRVGFVVSKKVHKRAVVRNRIKRLMRENIRLMLKNKQPCTINNYQSLIFTAKENTKGKNFDEIRNTILILMDKIANKNL